MSSGLSVIGLAVERSGKPVIHGVDIEIAPGKITALLGANGAGKSSLVLIDRRGIAGGTRPDSARR